MMTRRSRIEFYLPSSTVPAPGTIRPPAQSRYAVEVLTGGCVLIALSDAWEAWPNGRSGLNHAAAPIIVPGIIEDIPNQVERRPNLSVIAGGKR